MTFISPGESLQDRYPFLADKDKMLEFG